jgi:hypothetical protein
MSKLYRCVSCGAARQKEETSCTYCSSALVDKYGVPYKPPAVIPDYGWEGKGAIVASVIGVIVLFLVSIFYQKLGLTIQSSEKFGYYLLPLWVALFASLWKTDSRMTLLIGLIPALIMFSTCFIAYSIKEGRIFDWTYGFSAIMSGLVFGAWMLGRIVHILIRKRLAE